MMRIRKLMCEMKMKMKREREEMMVDGVNEKSYFCRQWQDGAWIGDQVGEHIVEGICHFASSPLIMVTSTVNNAICNPNIPPASTDRWAPKKG